VGQFFLEGLEKVKWDG